MPEAARGAGYLHKQNIVSGLSGLMVRFVAALALTIFCALAYAGAPPELEQAQALMRAGNPAGAYALLEPLEDKFSGDPTFDYVLGIAALDSGKPDKATLAFERVLAVDPAFAGARLDMARAYFQLGDLSRAKNEFLSVLEQNPPAQAKEVIQKYLAVIESREKATKTLVTGYMEGTIGRDSNVNNSSAQTQVSVPALGNLVFTLDPTNVQRADQYGMVTGGADIAHEVNPGVAVFGGGSGRLRVNKDADRFDNHSAEAHGGVVLAMDRLMFRGTLNAERYYLDHVRNRTTTGANGDLRFTINPANFVNGFVQHSRFRFDVPALTVNDFDMTLMGVGYVRLFHDGKSAINFTLFNGYESEVNTRADGNKTMIGFRVGGSLNLRGNLDAYASGGKQRGLYDRQNAAFLDTRHDNQTDVAAGLVWRIDNAWSLRPQVLYTRNDTNIPIYGFKRTDYSVTLRRDFK